ncbi:MAG: bacterial Ig-like domain-containing protein [Bacteroidales bacterium]|nr:bacterial Ig-like domain-containing protein [Bacteroidales bacterium]
MKKRVFSLGMMFFAALTFTNCAKQEVIAEVSEQLAGVPFELTAGVDTKTEATDAGVITWAEGDNLSVFHAEAGSTTYSKNDKFTFDSGSSFKGELQDGALTADAYDWYALYPYYYSIPAPDNTTTGYTTFAASQTQTGNSSKAHLCGSNVPMYGKATGVSKNVKPVITMNQAASVIKVQVTNALEDDLTVTSVTFTAPVNIVGNYFINFAGEQPSFKETGTPKKTVSLSVTGGAPIAKDGTADFYIVVKPFETAANDEITVSVNGLEKTIKLASAVTFAPGKIKTVNFAYDEAVSMFMWDLTTNSYSAASASQVTWNHEKAQMVADKASASTAPNNYLGGDANNRTSSRFYSNSKLTITPSAGVLILKVEAEATSDSYATTLKNSSWTNASASVDGTKVTITPTNGAIAFYATIGGTVGLTGVNVIYSELAQKNVASIAVTTPPTKTDYKVGETLDMSGAVITATYDDATTDDVTDFVTTDAAEVLAHAGDAKPVTVTFEGKNATFNVNVAKGDADLAYAKTDYKATINSAFATPTLTNPHNLTVTYSSSDEDLVLVDENTGDVVIGSTAGGPVTITASTTGNADYNAGSATYTITVKEPSEVAGTWASFPYTIAFAPSNNTVYSKVSSDFCGESATLEAYSSSNTKQNLSNYSGSFSAVYSSANIGSYWKVSLPVSKAIPEGTKITLSCYIAANAKVYNNWQVSYNGTVCGNAVNVKHNGSPSKLDDMTKVEGSYTTTADIAKDSVIEFRITAAKGDGTKAGNNRITQIIVTAE